MSNMRIKNDYHKIIANALINTGLFSISDIEHRAELSRESVGIILRKLVNDRILATTAKKGRNTKYKLIVSTKAILFLFQHHQQLTIDNFSCAWNISVSSAKKYIKQFVDDDTLNKFGTPPQKIIYSLSATKNKYDFSSEQIKIIEKHYTYTTADGQLLKGVAGFIYWAENKSNRTNIKDLAQEYIDLRQKFYHQQSKVILIDASDKLKNIFPENVYTKKLFHRDFDALPIFGKTNLSQMVRVAKSGHRNKVLMTNIVNEIQDSVDKIISKYDIDCLGFIPPTVIRKTQLMTFIANKLAYSCDKITISKVKTLVPVQQKSLKKIEDRILNAKKTISIDDNNKYENILLIDDVTGSGATLNETAKKIIDQNIAKNIYAFTITGSAKAGVFDIISEA